ncbi:carrier protein [Strigomonas culicis]|uniref:Carrier protein n=1 Tax=Strigomonas culicis TaxID=28005 RepID=S9V5L2_9TRYP|nr:carrier protein [Strigomonas culicis]|eukprot:EPY36369.1 carrier protein [Strigomonas culicis]
MEALTEIEHALLDDRPHPPHEHTTSVNRSYSDLDQRAFLCYGFSLCVARMVLQQPMNLALARKQTCAAANKMSTYHVLHRIVRQEGGCRGLSKGLAAFAIGSALSEVIYLGLFEYARERARLSSEAARDAAAAYVADFTCRLVYVPLSIVGFRQMTHVGPQTPSMRQTFRAMYRERGWRTVFAGLGTTLVVGCQWTAVWWMLYGYLKGVFYGAAAPLLQHSRAQQLPHWVRAADDNLLLNSAASLATSAATAVLFNPYLVVRTNLQVVRHATLWSVTRQLHRAHGPRVFFSGLSLNIGACIVDGFLASTAYEYAKLWADRSQQRAPERRAAVVAAAGRVGEKELI